MTLDRQITIIGIDFATKQTKVLLQDAVFDCTDEYCVAEWLSNYPDINSIIGNFTTIQVSIPFKTIKGLKVWSVVYDVETVTEKFFAFQDSTECFSFRQLTSDIVAGYFDNDLWDVQFTNMPYPVKVRPTRNLIMGIINGYCKTPQITAITRSKLVFTEYEVICGK